MQLGVVVPQQTERGSWWHLSQQAVQGLDRQPTLLGIEHQADQTRPGTRWQPDPRPGQDAAILADHVMARVTGSGVQAAQPAQLESRLPLCEIGSLDRGHGMGGGAQVEEVDPC